MHVFSSRPLQPFNTFVLLNFESFLLCWLPNVQNTSGCIINKSWHSIHDICQVILIALNIAVSIPHTAEFYCIAESSIIKLTVYLLISKQVTVEIALELILSNVAFDCRGTVATLAKGKRVKLLLRTYFHHHPTDCLGFQPKSRCILVGQVQESLSNCSGGGSYRWLRSTRKQQERDIGAENLQPSY